MFTSAVILAAGSGTRMGTDKVTALLCGKPVLLYSVDAFIASTVDEIIVCAAGANLGRITEILSLHRYEKPIKVVKGGATRFESALNCVRACDEKCGVVLIHDAARPLITVPIINAVAQSAEKNGAAFAAVRAKDSVKCCDGGFIADTPDRSRLWLAQTPQGFLKDEYLKAAQNFDINDERITDDCSVMTLSGYKAAVVEGDYRNIKLTTPEDFCTAKGFLEMDTPAVRMGHGYDVHRLVAGRRLILCGEEIENKEGLGLLGHSDADVAVHALMDAMLGAAALGDIGRHFPDSAEKYKGISSMKLLCEVVKRLFEKGFCVSNADITIVAEKPRLSPYIQKMRENIAAVLKLSVDNINVKATTEEGLGLAGQGIAAHAVCVIKTRAL